MIRATIEDKREHLREAMHHQGEALTICIAALGLISQSVGTDAAIATVALTEAHPLIARAVTEAFRSVD